MKIKKVNNYMALIRNLRNIIEANVSNDHMKKVIMAVSHDESVKRAQQLPFRFYAAYNAVKDIAPPSLLDAIEGAMVESLGSLPTFKGKVMSLCDNSGSALGAKTSTMGTIGVNVIGNLTGILTGMRADDGYVGIFGDDLKTQAIRKKSSIFETLEKLNEIGQGIGGGTENGIWLFWRDAIREKQHWDHVFVYSDMQAGHGGLYGIGETKNYPEYIFPGTNNSIDVPKLIAEYRRKVNPNVMVYLCQIAGQEDTILPEFFDRTYIIGGWGEGLLRFAAEMSGLYEQKPQQ